MNAHYMRFFAIISSTIQRLSPAYYYGQDTVFLLTPTVLPSERFCRREKCTEDVPPCIHAGTQGPPCPNRSWPLASNPIFSFSITSVMNIWPTIWNSRNYFPFLDTEPFVHVCAQDLSYSLIIQSSSSVAEQLYLLVTMQVGKRRQWTAWDISFPRGSHRL